MLSEIDGHVFKCRKCGNCCVPGCTHFTFDRRCAIHGSNERPWMCINFPMDIHTLRYHTRGTCQALQEIEEKIKKLSN